MCVMPTPLTRMWGVYPGSHPKTHSPALNRAYIDQEEIMLQFHPTLFCMFLSIISHWIVQGKVCLTVTTCFSRMNSDSDITWDSRGLGQFFPLNDCFKCTRCERLVTAILIVESNYAAKWYGPQSPRMRNTVNYKEKKQCLWACNKTKSMSSSVTDGQFSVLK